MLYSYQQTVQQLLSDIKEQLIPIGMITGWINRARLQIAAEGEAIRTTATQVLTNATQSYAFSGFTIAASGVANALTVREAAIIPSGSTIPTVLEQRPYEWLYAYYLAPGVAEATGVPARYAQLGQGSAGTVVLDPIPNGAHTLTMDVVALPISLVDDTTVEALPYPWQEAVPFRAAFYAMMYAQQQDVADRMLARSEIYVRGARLQATPTVLPKNQPGFDGAMAANRAVPLTVLPSRGNA